MPSFKLYRRSVNRKLYSEKIRPLPVRLLPHISSPDNLRHSLSEGWRRQCQSETIYRLYWWLLHTQSAELHHLALFGCKRARRREGGRDALGQIMGKVWREERVGVHVLRFLFEVFTPSSLSWFPVPTIFYVMSGGRHPECWHWNNVN